MNPRNAWITSGLVAAAIVVAGVGVATWQAGNLFWLNHASPGMCPSFGSSGGTTPLGTSLALNSPTEQSNRWNHWYNFSVQSAGGGITIREFTFNLTDASGRVVPAGTNWTILVSDWRTGPLASYDFSTGTWGSGSSATVTSDQTFALDSGTTSLSGAGESLAANYSGPCQAGSVSAAIP